MKLYQKILLIISLVFIFMFVMILVYGRTLRATYSTSCTLLGDVNNDGVVNKSDAFLIAQYVININQNKKISSCADVNKDSNIKMNDAMLVISGRINEPYIKNDDFPYIYEDNSARLTIEKHDYVSPYSLKTTTYYLAHLKITDYTRLHTGINNNGNSTYSSCGKNAYKVDKNTQSTVLVGSSCGKISVAAERENAIFAVEGDYTLKGGYNGIKGSIRDGEYYFVEGNQQDLTSLSATKIGYAFYNKHTGIMGPTSSLKSANAALAVSSGEVTDSFSFSSDLVVNGTFANTSYINNNSQHRQANFVGYKGKGEFYFVVSEGVAYSDSDKLSDGKSYGLLPKDRAQILIDLGCEYATQLDGGGSVIVWFMGKQLQSKYQIKTERDWLSDFVYFK